MVEAITCPKCGAGLPAGAPGGVCPRCLLLAGLDSEDDAQQPVGDSAFAATTPQPGGFLPPRPEELATRFPQLEIIELLGHGGMGAVYKARQTKLDRIVALKIIRPESADDPAFAERFNREARTLARLNHPHIIAVFDFGEVRSIPHAEREGFSGRTLYYFIMEYMDGANLRQLMQTGDLSADEALAIVPQVCDALQFAHDEGIVHRDIKPENILVDRRGRVKIADFGLAKLATRSDHDVTLTGTHQVMGTPRYMAPEQMEGSHAVDHRADIYSLGVVFYEMLTGQVPAGHFDPPSKRTPVDARLDHVVLRALARDPDRRYQQASDVKTDVETIAASADGAAAREIRDRSATNRVQWPMGTISLGVLVFVAGFLPWTDGGLTAWDSVFRVHRSGGLQLPNWLIPITGLAIAAIAVLRTLHVLRAPWALPVAAAYGLAHTMAAEYDLTTSARSEPGTGALFTGIALAALLFTNLGAAVGSAARWSVAFLVAAVTNVLLLLLLFMRGWTDDVIHNEVGQLAIGLSCVTATLQFILIAVSGAIRSRLSEAVAALRSEPFDLSRAIQWVSLFALVLSLPIIGTAILCTVEGPLGQAHAAEWVMRWPEWAALLATLSTITVAIAGFVMLWIPFVSSLAAEGGARLDQGVLGAVARDPERRYQQASDVKTNVESISSLRTSPGVRPSSTSGMPRSGSEREPVLKALRWLFVCVVFGVLILSIALSPRSGRTYSWSNEYQRLIRFWLDGHDLRAVPWIVLAAIILSAAIYRVIATWLRSQPNDTEHVVGGADRHVDAQEREPLPGPSTMIERAASRIVGAIRGGGVQRSLTHRAAPGVMAILLGLGVVITLFVPWGESLNLDHPLPGGLFYGYHDPVSVTVGAVCFVLAVTLFAAGTSRRIPVWRPWVILLTALVSLGGMALFYSANKPFGEWRVEGGFLTAVGLGAALMLVAAWDVRMLLAQRADEDTSEPNDEEYSSVLGGRDWVTLSREQVETDDLPDVCIVCGRPTQERLNKDFAYQSDWAGVLTVMGMLCGVVPGLIIASLTERQQRIACPVCPRHRNHWSRFIVWASTGWIIPLALGGICGLIGWAIRAEDFVAMIAALAGTVVGVIVYLIPLIRMAATRIDAEEITDTQVRLRHVSAAFARAVGGRTSPPAASPECAPAASTADNRRT